MIEIIIGNILECDAKYICHQTNCVSKNSAGLAKDLFNKYSYANCYSDRTDSSKPGTIDIRGNGINQRLVINLHGQVYPGKVRYPDSELDGILAREKYFYHGLLRIAKIPDLQSIAFPWRIGCNLAGGNWGNYFCMLNNFAKYVKNTYDTKVILYKREDDE